jgi:hypothetical protein
LAARELYLSKVATIDQQRPGNYDLLFGAPRPRRVRVRTIPRIVSVVFPVAAVFLIFFGVQERYDSRQLGAQPSLFNNVVFNFIFPTILIVESIVIFRMVRRDGELLRNGELAMGVVTHQKIVEVHGGRGGRRKRSRVRYRFKDESGQLFQGTGTDYSRRLRVDMTVPVFYNPENPEKNVAMCTAICELRSD